MIESVLFAQQSMLLDASLHSPRMRVVTFLLLGDQDKHLSLRRLLQTPGRRRWLGMAGALNRRTLHGTDGRELDFGFATDFIDELTSELNRTEGGQDVFFTSTDRQVLLDLLTCEFQALLSRDRGSKESIENLLKHLDSARTSAGLTCDVYRMYEPEQMVSQSGIDYSQSFEAIFRYEDVELGSWFLESKGRFEAGEWRGEPAEWPEVLKGLAPLPHVMIKIPDLDLYVTTDPAARKQGVQRREREFLSELERCSLSWGKNVQTFGGTVPLNPPPERTPPER
jgi:hypothetical protein